MSEVAYPCAKEVGELFDVTVVADIEEPGDGEHKAGCPKTDADGEECTCNPVQVYALGWPQELSAGIRGGYMTPFFRSMDALEAFCKKHLERFREAAQACERDLDVSVPDATTWEV